MSIFLQIGIAATFGFSGIMQHFIYGFRRMVVKLYFDIISTFSPFILCNSDTRNSHLSSFLILSFPMKGLFLLNLGLYNVHTLSLSLTDTHNIDLWLHYHRIWGREVLFFSSFVSPGYLNLSLRKISLVFFFSMDVPGCL